MKRSFGCLPDKYTAYGSHTFREVCGAVERLPESVDLRPLLAPIVDQGGTESCPGQAGANAICQALRRVNPNAERPSALLLWDMARGLDGHRGLNIGSTLGAIEEAARVAGFAPESAVPWDERRACEGLFADEYQAAILQLGIRSHRVFAESDERVAAIKTALARGLGVAIGMDVDQSFCDHVGSDVWRGMMGARLGGHAMSGCGYSPEALLVVNSLGLDWGDRGCGWIGWSYITSERCRSIWIVDAAPEYWRAE